MYVCIDLKGVLANGDRTWVDIPFDKITLRQLFAAYTALQATLTNKVLPKAVYLDLYQLYNDIGSYDIPIQTWLNSIGNKSLPTTDIPSPTVTKYVRYGDAFQAGYKFKAVSGNVGSDVVLPEADKTWLQLNKPGMNPELIGKTTLALINGLYHQTAWDPTGFFVIDGMKSARRARGSIYGLVTFADIGQIRQVPITKEMIYKQKAETPLAYRTYVNAGQDLSNAFVFFVIGGYLHPVDGKQILRMSDRTFCIDFENIPLLQRYFESKDKIDLSSLKLDVSAFNAKAISRRQLMTDQVITEYLTISQSFMVILNNPKVQISYEALQETKAPGVYTTDTSPLWPIATKSGRHSNYTTVSNKYGKRGYTIRMADSFLRNYLFKTTGEDNFNVVDNQTIPFEKVTNSQAFFVKIAAA